MSTPRASGTPPTELRKRYHVIAKLGEGGMALVHLAVVRGVGGVRKLVVLKSIRPELVTELRMREMFLTEARLAATLSHPNVVQSFEVVVFAGRPVLVMEYLDGQSLSRIVHRDRREKVPLSAQLYVMKEVLSGLEYVHNFTDLDGTPLNLVHRDISPPNIFVTYDGHVKILDFGIAKNIAASGNTEAGVIKGKIRYMSPEQLLGAAGLDRRADIFAAGVMLWEAITGKRLWDGVPEVQVMQNLLNGGTPAPSTVAPNVPPALEAVCKRALAHGCDERYESAAAMQTELEAAIEELGLGTNHRNVGKLVSELFAERRVSTRNILEQQLGDEGAPPVSLVSEESDADRTASTEGAGVGADLWGVPTAISVGPARPWRAELRRKVVVPGSIAAVGLVVSFVAVAHSRHVKGGELQPTTGMSPATSTAAAPLAAATDALRSVSVTIRATPLRARLFLDDVLLSGNPFKGEVPSDSGHHSVRAEARGYRPQTFAVTFAEPLDLDFDLDAVGAPLALLKPTPAKSVPLPVSSASEPSPSSTRSCKPPFYFDESGIKRIKIECLK